MSLPNAETISEDLIYAEGVLTQAPEIGRMPGGGAFAACRIRTSDPVGDGDDAQNTSWQVLIHRLPAVEQMKAAIPGDILEIRGAVADGRIIVPRTSGRVDILLSD